MESEYKLYVKEVRPVFHLYDHHGNRLPDELYKLHQPEAKHVKVRTLSISFITPRQEEDVIKQLKSLKNVGSYMHL